MAAVVRGDMACDSVVSHHRHWRARVATVDMLAPSAMACEPAEMDSARAAVACVQSVMGRSSVADKAAEVELSLKAIRKPVYNEGSESIKIQYSEF